MRSLLISALLAQLRCSRTQPCTRCAQANHACEYRDADTKRRPVSRDYVLSLESRVVWLEALLTKVKNASPPERDSILDQVFFKDHLELSDVEIDTCLVALSTCTDHESSRSRYLQAETE